MGGSVLCDIFYQSNPQEAAVELASRLDCTSEKGEDIVRCLSTQTQQDIIKKQSDMFVSITLYQITTTRIIIGYKIYL